MARTLTPAEFCDSRRMWEVSDVKSLITFPEEESSPHFDKSVVCASTCNEASIM